MSADLLVVTALGIEERAVRRALPGIRLLRSGMGAARARGIGPRLEAVDPAAVAIMGFCGAVDPSLQPGDVVVATEVRGPQGSVPVASAGLLSAALRRHGIPARLGPLRTVGRVEPPATRRRYLDEATLAVDMESAYITRLVGDRPLAVIRVVVDDAESSLWHPRTIRAGLKARERLAAAATVLESWAGAVGDRRVLLAGPRSFCAGVDRAIGVVRAALERFGAPIYVRKQIVHNLHVVSELEDLGAVFVDDIEDVPENATVVFSAHGVSPQVREDATRRSLSVIDATCPLVSKVHAEARRFAGNDRHIFLIGHEGHEEIEGTSGEAPGSITLVQTVADAEVVEVDDPTRVSYLSQTTLSLDETSEILDVLKRRFPALTGPSSNDICYATQNRQDALKAMGDECDLLLVVGSRNSSNSKRLVEVSQRAGTPAYLIDDDGDIDPSWLHGARTIGLTAGASAPEKLVWQVVDALRGLGSVTVEERSITQEDVTFYLPKEVAH